MKSELEKFLVVAKAAVYNQQRAEQYLQMMESRGGAIQAALSILGAIEAKAPIPEPVKPVLAINIYLMLVDLSMAATGQQPDKDAMKQTIAALLQQIAPNGQQGQQQPQQMQPPQQAQPAAQPPQGMLAGVA